jgi:hypothetical protein
MYPDDDAVVERTTESASDGAGAPEVEAEQGQPEAETGDQAAAGEGAEAEAAVETPQPRTPWFQTRINELTRGKYDEQRRRQAAESELALVKARLTAMEGRDPAGDAATDAENVSAGPKVTRPSINITPADEIERRAGKQKAVSKAPPPLKTIDGAGRSPEVDPDKMSIGEWMKWREKEATQAHKARWTR